MEIIKAEIGEITGITKQREGQIQVRESVGGVERSVRQSSHITEEWFMIHDNTKTRCLQMLLEVAKHAWRGKKKKLQYIDGNLGNTVFEVDGDDFWESEYAIDISNTQNDDELLVNVTVQ